MRDYEIVWILGDGAGDNEGRASAEKIRELVSSLGGKTTAVKPWGKRSLAYPIERYTEGFYIESQFSLDPSKANDFRRAIDADREIIRHIIVKK